MSEEKLKQNVLLYKHLCGVCGLDASRELLNILVQDELSEKLPEIANVNIDKELWNAIHTWKAVIEEASKE